MAGTDPYGQFLNLGTALGGAVVGGIVGGVAAAINGEDWLEGAAKRAVVGGIAGATLGVGLAIAGTTTTATVVGSGIASGITGAAANAVVYEGRAPTLEELSWGGLFGGATAGTFHVAYGVGRAGLGAIWGKRSAVAPAPDIPTIGGRKPINSGYAGEVHPSGIRFNALGFPDFGPVAVAEVQITGLTGNYVKDAAMANAAVGIKLTPKGFVWHHVEDGVTMQLVPMAIHNSTRHTGGAAIIRNGGCFDK